MRIMIVDTRSQISNNMSRNPYTRKNRALLKFGVKQAVFMPTNIKELETPLDLAE